MLFAPPERIVYSVRISVASDPVIILSLFMSPSISGASVVVAVVVVVTVFFVVDVEEAVVFLAVDVVVFEAVLFAVVFDAVVLGKGGFVVETEVVAGFFWVAVVVLATEDSFGRDNLLMSIVSVKEVS